MRTTLLTTTLLAVAIVIAPTRLHAQPGRTDGSIAIGQTVTGTFDYARFGQRQQKRYRVVPNVKAGTTLRVTFAFTSDNDFGANVVTYFSDPGSDSATAKTTLFGDDLGSRYTVSRTFDRSGPVTVIMVGDPTSFGEEFSITLSDSRSATAAGNPKRSIVSGLHLAAGYNAMEFESQFSTEKGTGQSARFGLGFGPLLFFGEYGAAEMVPEGDGYSADDEYTLTNMDLGARLYVLGEGSRIRPFAQASFGRRRLKSATSTTEAEGDALTPGAGIELFLMSRMSLEGAYTQASGEIGRARNDGGEWLELPAEYVVKGTTRRISAQLVFHF